MGCMRMALEKCHGLHDEFRCSFIAKGLNEFHSGLLGQEIHGPKGPDGPMESMGPHGAQAHGAGPATSGPSLLAADLRKNMSWEKVMCCMLSSCVSWVDSMESETKG